LPGGGTCEMRLRPACGSRPMAWAPAFIPRSRSCADFSRMFPISCTQQRRCRTRGKTARIATREPGSRHSESAAAVRLPAHGGTDPGAGLPSQVFASLDVAVLTRRGLLERSQLFVCHIGCALGSILSRCTRLRLNDPHHHCKAAGRGAGDRPLVQNKPASIRSE